jgi:threonine dehydrogenase-like Zn-dependent dehydrogenase
MRALTYHGKHDVRVDTHPDPEIVNPRDAIIEITSTAICGSDLHLFDGVIPGVLKGDILGHEFMGRVVEVGPKSTLKVGQRVTVPFTISCGACFHCRNEEFSHCDNSNPAEKQDMSETLYGHPMSGLFGYSHMTGGYPGGQAEFVRVPFSDVGPLVIPDHLEDEKVLFLTDILSTGWMAADQATVEQGDTIVVWGAGPVGLFAAQSARVMGADQVIVIDHYPHRLELARRLGCLVIDFNQTNIQEALMEMTGGQGPDAVIDAVGMESHGFGNANFPDTVKQKIGIGADRIGALRQAIFAVRKGGRVSIPGVYGGVADKFPTGAMMEKGLTLRMGQTHVQRYHKELLRRIEEGEIDTTFLISHTMSLEDAPTGYKNFAYNQNEWTKVVLKPAWEKGRQEAGRANMANRTPAGSTPGSVHADGTQKGVLTHA